MNSKFTIHLKANEKIFVNGGVLKVDRKVTIEFLNDVAFLLQTYVVQQEEATTPLRQLYYLVQSMLIEPNQQQRAREIYDQSHHMLLCAFRNQDVLDGLVDVRHLIERNRPFDALKRIRALFKIEDEIMFAQAREQVVVSVR